MLASGGLDSSVLLADLARDAAVFPLYVQAGLVWEENEGKALEAFVSALGNPNVRPVTTLSVPVAPLYGDHWSVTGSDAPAAGTADSGLLLPGRNVLLVALAAVWCSTHNVHRIAIGSLDGNPFPDATPEFFESFGGALGMGLAHGIEVVAPFLGLQKRELVGRHADLPLHLTLTCITPDDGSHCGVCLKCEERQHAFRQAGVRDRTTYARAVGKADLRPRS